MKKLALAAVAASVMLFNACTPKPAEDDKKAQKIDTTLAVTKTAPPVQSLPSVDSVAVARQALEDTLERARSEIGEDAAYDLETIKTKILLSKEAERDALIANLDNIMTKFNAAHSSKAYRVKATIEASAAENSAAGVTLTTKVFVQDSLRNKTYFENNAQVE